MALRALTGIKPTGEPHIGNWLGAIKPALELAQKYDTYYFIADYHALNAVQDPAALKKMTLGIAATYLALGLDPERSVFYRQSDVPEILELQWILNCFTPKGLMNRAHSYKDAVAKNEAAKNDSDFGVNMGLYCYPILMAADILMFRSNVVPVGQDQKQHLEIARDIAGAFNNIYKAEVFVLPEPKIDDQVKIVLGLDGRKMSKSYGNAIPLWLEEKALLKRINQIVTNSQTPEEPKDPDQSAIFAMHKLFIDPPEEARLRETYRKGGMGWGAAKKEFFEILNAQLRGPRREYQRLLEDPGHLEAVLKKGRDRARSESAPYLDRIRKTIGIG